jgi:hypothetical protein
MGIAFTPITYPADELKVAYGLPQRTQASV